MSIFNGLQINASGLSLERMKLDVASTNIANVNTTRTAEGGPYKKKTVEFSENLHRFPDWMLAQMERDLEWNFELMEMRRDGDGKVKFDDDCEFQRPMLEAIKQEREARK